MNGRLPAQGEVHLWPMALDLPDTEQAPLTELLGEDEHVRSATFRHALHRRRYVAARGQLRQLLGGYLARDPAAIRFNYGLHGKPALAELASPLQFNISHSGAHALCVVSDSVPVGVDLENRASIDDLDALARHIMSPLETLLFAELPPKARHEAFYACWTRKEAYLKARGLGVATALRKVSVSLACESRPKLLQCENNLESPEDWTLYSFQLPGDFAAAVAVSEKIHSCNWQRAWPET